MIVHGVYATREAFVPSYYAPRDCPRFSIDPREDEAAAPVLERRVGPLPEARRLIVFGADDRAGLERHAVSVYAFDASHFRALPTREFLSDGAVEPLRETPHQDALAAIEGAGWTVRFVDGLGAIRELRAALEAAGVRRFSAEKIGR